MADGSGLNSFFELLVEIAEDRQTELSLRENASE
jgi:hypothetical protein